MAAARDLVLIHHDPDHADDVVDDIAATASRLREDGTARAAAEGMVLELESQ